MDPLARDRVKDRRQRFAEGCLDQFAANRLLGDARIQQDRGDIGSFGLTPGEFGNFDRHVGGGPSQKTVLGIASMPR